jgi:hypothetical protein
MAGGRAGGRAGRRAGWRAGGRRAGWRGGRAPHAHRVLPKEPRPDSVRQEASGKLRACVWAWFGWTCKKPVHTFLLAGCLVCLFRCCVCAILQHALDCAQGAASRLCGYLPLEPAGCGQCCSQGCIYWGVCILPGDIIQPRKGGYLLQRDGWHPSTSATAARTVGWVGGLNLEE